MIIKTILPIIILSVVFLGSAGLVSAQSGFTGYLDNLPGAQISLEWLFATLGSLACYLLQFAIISIGVMIVVYGIMFIKSRGNPQGVTTAKKSLTWGLVGGLVIFGVFTIILTLGDIIGVTNYPILDIVKCS